MPYRRRIHVHGGTYHVVQRGSRLHPIFLHPDEYAFFENVLQGALRSSGARLHAYCWTTAAVYLAVQLDGASIGHFMQLLKSRYARGAQQRRGERGYFFQGRYDAVIIEPDAYLLRLIQYIHYVPVLAGLAKTPDDYPQTSHHAYREARALPWLHTQTALQLLGSSGEYRLRYHKLMSEPPLPQTVRLFERGAPNSPGILGRPEFVEIVSRRVPRAPRMTPDQVTHYVCCLLNVSRDDVRSRSRLRKLALARAMIAWHTAVRGVATIAEISRYLGRASSTLSQGISLYRERYPELFKRDALEGVAPKTLPQAASTADAPVSDRESQRNQSRLNGGTSK